MSNLKEIITVYPHVASTILETLLPSEVSKLYAAIDVEPSDYDRRKFLDPTREVLDSSVQYNSETSIIMIGDCVKSLVYSKRPMGALHVLAISSSMSDVCEMPKIRFGTLSNAIFYGSLYRTTTAYNDLYRLLISTSACPMSRLPRRLIEETLALAPDFRLNLERWVSRGLGDCHWTRTVDCTVSAQSGWRFDKVLINAHGRHVQHDIPEYGVLPIIEVELTIPTEKENRLFSTIFFYDYA